MARYSKTVKLPGGLVIETDRGTVIVGDTDDADIVFQPNDAPDLKHVVGKRNPVALDNFYPFVEQLADFVNACESGSSPRATGEQGLQSLQLIEDLYKRRSPLDRDWYRGSIKGLA